MGKEIERKFLVDKEVWDNMNKPEGKLYKQGYMLVSPKKTIRVRTTPENGYITIKGKTSGTTRLEYEYPIPIEDAEELLAHFTKNIVEKKRYRIPYKGKLWEVDEFYNENEGLIMAEIELKEEQEAFDKPIWIYKEVTSDNRYYNSYLSQHPFREWGKS